MIEPPADLEYLAKQSTFGGLLKFNPDRSLSAVLTLALAIQGAVTTLHAQSATLSGVVRDTAGLALPNVEVSIAALSKASRTDNEGRYRITDIPSGTIRLAARRIGYELWSDSVSMPDHDTERNIVLRAAAVVLDSVPVVAQRNDRLLDEFEEHRKLGFGHFITSAELRKAEGQRMSSVLAMVPGLGTVPGVGGEAWIVSKRAPMAISSACIPTDFSPPGGKIYVPTKGEARRGIRCQCYAQVYLDNALMNSGQPTEPFNVNDIPVSQVEAIEFYAGPAQTPSKYSRLGSPCGVYVIHTRRPP